MALTLRWVSEGDRVPPSGGVIEWCKLHLLVVSVLMNVAGRE